MFLRSILNTKIHLRQLNVVFQSSSIKINTLLFYVHLQLVGGLFNDRLSWIETDSIVSQIVWILNINVAEKQFLQYQIEFKSISKHILFSSCIWNFKKKRMKQIVSGNRFQNQKAPILICIKCENKINKFPYGKPNKTEREKGGRLKESASIFLVSRCVTICSCSYYTAF